MYSLKKFLLKICHFNFLRKLKLIEIFLFGFDKCFKNMSNGEIFNKIYKEGRWGENKIGDSISGIGSHDDVVIKPYIFKVSKFLLDIKPSIIVDLGCGDFNIGKNFVNKCEKYIACDVSSEILDRNKEVFSSFKNVDFKLLDLSSNNLPKGDICFVRQVLQHLSNSDINSFVSNLNANKPYKYLVVTEHLPIVDNFVANIDKNTGPGTRIWLNSGVVLHKKPFYLKALKISDLLQVNQFGGRIKTTIYQF